MNGVRPVVALSVLVSGLDAETVRLGCKDSAMVWYRGAWRRLQRYFAAREAEEFSLDVALAWADEACGFFAKEQAGIVASGLPGWNKDPGLPGWLTSLWPVIRNYAQCQTPSVAVTRAGRPALRIMRHCS
jgi:hypothetical protein